MAKNRQSVELVCVHICMIVDICRVYNLCFPNAFVGWRGLVFHLLGRVASAFIGGLFQGVFQLS